MKLSASLGAVLFLAIGLPASATPVTAVLQLQPKVTMAQLATDVTNPSSPRYQKYYSPEEIRQFAGPSNGAYSQLLAQLKHEGFSIVHESATHLWLTVSGDSSNFERTFSAQIAVNGQIRHLLIPAQVPARLSLVLGVIGLDNTRHSFPKYKVSKVLPKANGGPDSGIAQATIKSAYQLTPIYAKGISGQGQNIAVATYMTFSTSEVQTFYTQSNLSPLPTVDQVTFNGTPGADTDSAVETELDAEFSGMIAPGAAVHVFTSATNDDAGEAAVFTAILDDNRSKVANYSWGDCETTLDADHKAQMEPIFQRAVAQGVNIMVASGDNGSDTCETNTTVADWPSADDNVVSVGGSSFGQNGSQIAETAWVDGGGGVSGLWALPAWQTGLNVLSGSSQSSALTMRGYPDVAFNADPDTGQAVYATVEQGGTPTWMIIGGTSMAGPQWAGFMALVDSARSAAGKAPLGYLPPLIYSLTSTVKAQDFNDITSGCNGAYCSGAGWDAVTGWGSMQGINLLNTLVAQ